MSPMKNQDMSMEFFFRTNEDPVSIGKNFPALPAKNTETVLFVDDEDIVRDVGKKIMGRMGYDVILACSGKEAIEVYQERHGDIDVVILDLVMPDMQGGEAFDELRAINEEVKVLLSSGYGLEGEAQEIMRRGCNGFMQKPFNMRELSVKLREILGA